MLTGVRFVDFKSFDDQRVALAPLTLLVGANASGKSNLLDGLRVLHGLGLGLTVDEVLNGRENGAKEAWGGIRGGATSSRRGAASFAIETTWQIDGVAMTHALRCAPSVPSSILEESLSEGIVEDPASPVISARRAEGDALEGTVTRQDPETGLSIPFRASASRSLLAQVGAIPQQGADLRCLAFLSEIHAQAEAMLFLDIAPAQMRTYVSVGRSRIGVHGENLSSVLHQLCEDKAAKRDVLDWISELCAPPVVDLDFDVTRLKQVMWILVESGGVQVPAHSVSDGTLRFVGLLVALLTVPPGSIVLLEEPDLGLHPARVHLLSELLEELVRERGIQIIATTHSPALLAGMGHETLGAAIAFGRAPDSAETVMRRLRDLPAFEELLEERGIEYLFTTKWLEHAL